jgi:hypothetical protein
MAHDVNKYTSNGNTSGSVQKRGSNYVSAWLGSTRQYVCLTAIKITRAITTPIQFLHVYTTNNPSWSIAKLSVQYTGGSLQATVLSVVAGGPTLTTTTTIQYNQWYWFASFYYEPAGRKLYVAFSDKPDFSTFVTPGTSTSLNDGYHLATINAEFDVNTGDNTHEALVSPTAVYGDNTRIRTDWANNKYPPFSDDYAHAWLTFPTYLDNVLSLKIVRGITIDSILNAESNEVRSPVTSATAGTGGSVVAPTTTSTKLSDKIKSGMSTIGNKFLKTALTGLSNPTGTLTDIGHDTFDALSGVFNTSLDLATKSNEFMSDTIGKQFQGMFKTGLVEAADVIQDGVKLLIEARKIDFASWLKTNIIDVIDFITLITDITTELGGSALYDLTTLADQVDTWLGVIETAIENKIDAIDFTTLVNNITDTLVTAARDAILLVLNDTTAGLPKIIALISAIYDLFVSLDTTKIINLINGFGEEIMQILEAKILDPNWVLRVATFITKFTSAIEVTIY